MLLEIKNLHVKYGNVEVLHGINLHVDEGEIVTILGANLFGDWLRDVLDPRTRQSLDSAREG